MTLKEKLNLDRDPVFLMDGTAYIYRSFYANRHLQRSDGFPTNALVLVTRILLRILRQEQPRYFLFAMDGKGKNFRNDIYDQYKANREAMPEDLRLQMEPIRHMVKALGLTLEVAQGFEADDCIASLAWRLRQEHPVIIVSGDKDLKQCLGPNVFMWDPGVKDEKLLTMAEFEMENGVLPDQWPDVQALVGDSSDNIPGVPGIGPKTAKQIFAICPTLEDIKNHLDRLPPKIQAKLEGHLDEMFKWRELTTLKKDAFEHLGLDNLLVGSLNVRQCENLAGEYELAAVRREITALQKNRSGQPVIKAAAEDKAAESIELPLPAANQVDSSKALPPCEGLAVAIIWPEDKKMSPRLALGSPFDDQTNPLPDAIQEYAWAGSMSDLCAWLGKAAEIIVADLKALLTASPSWRELATHIPDSGGRMKFFDLGLASYLLNPEDGDYSWPRMAKRWREPLKCENSGPAVLALQMRHALEKTMAANELRDLYYQLEMPLIMVLARMQELGFAINPAAFRSFLQDVQGELDAITEKIYQEAGIHFNIRSSQQLADVLYNKFHLTDNKKTPGGKPSTSQATLEKLAPHNPMVENILQARKLEKMRSTYLDPLPRLMDAQNRIHTTFNQEATATGRLSSSNPNLQNIPVRGSLGRRMRACFVAAPDQYLVAADYSQIELRILASLSGDETLLTAFKNGVDIHAATAALIFDKADKDITADQRRMAKTINFGLLYGMGASKLAQELKTSLTEAKGFIERYFSGLAQLKKFYDEILVGARQHGYVTTMAGRRRWLPGIFSENGQAVAQAQRQAINAVIQGSAADIIKLAMLAVARDEFLLENKARLVLQVHDELLLEAPESAAHACGEKVADLMRDIHPGGQTLSVPLQVEWGVGLNWGVAH